MSRGNNHCSSRGLVQARKCLGKIEYNIGERTNFLLAQIRIRRAFIFGYVLYARKGAHYSVATCGI